MTVCVAIKVHDCVVFAADSAVSTTTKTPDGETLVQNVWQHGLKVFNLHRELPIMAMTAGLGNFGTMSVGSLAKDLRIQLTRDLKGDSYTIERAVNDAQRFFQGEYEKIDPPLADPPSFEFWIGGYGDATKHGEIWKITILDGQFMQPVQLASPMVSGQVLWGGQVDAINRLLIGCDPHLRLSLLELGLDANQLQAIESELLKIQTPLVHPSMPAQDAIDLADFLVDLTKRYVAFLPQADTVGGATDIATVTRHEGFKWIRRKHYDPAHLDIRSSEHAT